MGTLDKWIQEEGKKDTYWVERAKLDFAFSLENQRRRSGKTSVAIANALGVTRAYISKVFRGDVNFTIESMVKLARASGGDLSIRILPQAASAAWATVPAHSGLTHPVAPAANSCSTIVKLKDYVDGRGIAA